MSLTHSNRGTARPSPARMAPLAGRDRVEIAVVLFAVAYGVLALLLPHPYQTFDEAKYFAIGQNALAGLGPLTAFGARFLPHAPMWAMIFAAPKVALGLDPYPWGYVLNAVAATGVLLLGARFARRWGRTAMLLTVAVLAGWIDLFLLSRTARLDVPEAALALAYLAVAMSAIETGLVRRGILAGVLFAFAFLVKESCLVLLAAPFIAGIAVRQPIARVARAAGLVLLLAVPLVSWWFAWYAAATGTVFALGLGKSALVPLAVGLIVLGLALVGVGLDREPIARARALVDARLADRRVALGVAAVLSAVWVVLFLFAFARSGVLQGRPLLDLNNLARWLRTWVRELGPVALVGIGGVAAVAGLARRDDRAAEPLIALLAGSTWVLLVAVLGEPPRNDIAEITLLVALGAGGWTLIGEALRGRARTTQFAAVALGAAVAVVMVEEAAWAGITLPHLRGLTGVLMAAIAGAVAGGVLVGPPLQRRMEARVRGSRRASWLDGRMLAVTLVTALAVGALGAITVRSLVIPPSTTRAELATAVADWLDTNVPAGSTVLFSSVQSNETATVLGGAFQLRHLQGALGVTSPAAPLGVTVAGKPVSDLVVLDAHPRQDALLVFTASTISRVLAAARPAAIVYVTGIESSTPSMVAWLSNAPGISLATTIESPPGPNRLTAHIYRVDIASLATPADRTYASSGGVLALLDALGTDPRAPAIAAALLARIEFTDPGAAADAAKARLAAVAAR